MLRKKITAVVLGAAMCVAALAGCSSSTAPTATTTTAAKTTIKIDGSTSVYPLMSSLVDEYTSQNKNVTIQVEQGGSGVGIQDAKNGNVDIGMSSRDLTSTETGLVTNKICTDGIAVILNTGNKVTTLTADQLKKIYSFEITNWKDVGGADHKIDVVTREATSGTRGAFEELVLAKKVIDETKCAAVANSTGNVMQTVKSDTYAIGYISLGSLDTTVKAVKLNDFEATAANVLNGTYKLSRPFLLVTAKEPTGAVKDFINWIKTNAKALEIIKNEKYITGN